MYKRQVWSRANTWRRLGPWVALGGLLYGLAVSADPYPLVLAPIVLGYGVIVALERPARWLPLLLGGALIGLVPFVLLHRAAGAKSGPMGLTFGAIPHNWDLLVRECLPWALSYKVYFARNAMDYLPWSPPLAVKVIQLAGAAVVAGIVLVGLFSVARRSVPWPTRRLGFAGAMTYPVVIGAFLISVMVMDHFSMRYLAALTLMLPFAAIPAAVLMKGRRRWLLLLLAPHLVASAIGGWVG